MHNLFKVALVSGAIAALAGCSAFDKNGPEGGAQAPIVNGQSSTVKTSGVSTSSGIAGNSIAGSTYSADSTGDAPEGIPNIIHFGFDKYSLGTKAQKFANQNAHYLLQHPDVHVMITGNTDPRGSQEYNFHLGQRRADAVQSYLLSQGVPASQMCTVSYGELRPAATPAQFSGDWRKAYTLDRRAVIVYGKTCEGQEHHA